MIEKMKRKMNGGSKAGYSVVGIDLGHGDSGKLAVFDRLLGSFTDEVRPNGGPNSGHEGEVEGRRFKTHGGPLGVAHPHLWYHLGPGCLVGEKLNQEIENNENNGFNIKERLHISAKSSLIQPSHIIFDTIVGKDVGTTKNGIGPAYADKSYRKILGVMKNLRIGDYLNNPLKFKNDAKGNLEEVIERFGKETIGGKKVKDTDVNQLVDRFDNEVNKLGQYVCFDPLCLERRSEQGARLFIGLANGCLLDPEDGDVPYVTSSRISTAGAYLGAGLSLRHHRSTQGVIKVIPTRVGRGPLVGEYGGERSEKYCMEKQGYKYVKEVEQGMYDPDELLKSSDLLDIGKGLRIIGKEYGATTSRPRRLGMLNLVVLRQFCRLNAVDSVHLTKFDLLPLFAQTPLKGIPVVTNYKLDGKTIDYHPCVTEDVRRVEPVVEFFPHIKDDISGIREYQKMPGEAKEFVRRVQEALGVDVATLGLGPARDQYVTVP